MTWIGLAPEMHEAFPGRELAEETGMPPLQPDMPGSGEKEKNQDSIPAQEFAKPETPTILVQRGIRSQAVAAKIANPPHMLME